jgi:hypothetical protein
MCCEIIFRDGWFKELIILMIIRVWRPAVSFLLFPGLFVEQWP